MALVQNCSFASYGSADTLMADGDTIRQFICQTSLPVVDQLAILFLRRYPLCQSKLLFRTMPVNPAPIACEHTGSVIS
jgi:hypothetical protein